MLSDYLVELEAEGHLWAVVDQMLSEHARSLQIDESLEAEQLQRLQARASRLRANSLRPALLTPLFPCHKEPASSSPAA